MSGGDGGSKRAVRWAVETSNVHTSFKERGSEQAEGHREATSEDYRVVANCSLVGGVWALSFRVLLIYFERERKGRRKRRETSAWKRNIH